MKSIFALFLFLLVFSHSLVQSQTPFWQQTQGPGGGMITSLTVTPNGHIFAARIDHYLSFGGVFRSSDNGAHWAEADSGLSYLHGPYGALHTDSYGNIFLVSDTDIFRSTDEGEHWSNINTGLPPHVIVSMLINSQSGNLYAFFDSSKYGNEAMYRSTDHGSHWSPTSDQRFYNSSAALDSSGNIYVYSVYRGIFRSSDEGTSWQKMAPLTVNDFSDGLAVTKTGILISTNSSGRTIKRSIDNGASLQTVDSNVNTTFMGPTFIASNGSIFIGLSGTTTHTSNKILRSTDNGTTWIGLSAGLENLPFVEANSFAENAQGEIFVGLTQGVYKSSDNGDHWVDANNGLLLSACSSIIEGANGHLFAGTDYGQIFRSRDSGMTWVLASDGLEFFPIPRVIVFGNNGGIWGELSLPRFAATPNGHLFAGGLGANYLYRSVDEGDHWIPIDSSFYSRTIGVDKTGRIFSEAYNISDQHEAIFRSTDDGDHWTKVGTPAGLDSLYVVSIVSNHAEHIFISGNYYSPSTGMPLGSAVFISTDHGDSWNPTSNEIAPYAINTLATIKNGTGVFVGTDSGGIFLSTDEGAHWKQVYKLFDSAVTSITLHPDGSVFAGLSQRIIEQDEGIGQGPADTLGGDVIISADDGVSWKSIKSGIKNIDGNGVSAVTATTNGYVFAGMGYGKGGGIYRGFKSLPLGVRETRNSEAACWIKTIYPVSSSPILEFSLPQGGEIKLEIYNETGEQVDVIASEFFSEGVHKVSWNTEKINSGIFFAKLRTPNLSATTTVRVVK